MNNLEKCLGYLQLPIQPTKVWDKKTPFYKGLGKILRADNTQDWVIVKYDSENEKPKICIDYGIGTITKLLEIYPIPTNFVRDENEMFFASPIDRENYMALFYQAENEIKEDKQSACDNDEEQYEWILPDITTQGEAIEWLKSKGEKSTHLLKNPDTIKAKILLLKDKL